MTRSPRRTVRRLGLAGVVAFVAAAAGLVLTGSPAGAVASPSYVRLAHLSPDTPKVDVYMTSYTRPDWKFLLKGVGYGAVSPYQRVQPDRYAVSMRPAGAPASSPPVLSTNLDAAAGKAYTVAGVGPYAALGLTVLNDDLTLPPSGQSPGAGDQRFGPGADRVGDRAERADRHRRRRVREGDALLDGAGRKVDDAGRVDLAAGPGDDRGRRPLGR